ncbi:cyclopropane-fatty-acyl-phospholipid synthase [Prosthecochloris sp. GSB1]|uniref:cyclopropane fatty acyl phospholipid synthase n=1 Tax=Prosthecochloris sp. GSB1 TaxID=281093 RepID=UPI000B8CFF69|nr:cyclopropane fatty acyl phospholipid synthase [Prosthecochloris sp. GSB1]ASQ90307.1 cyclopropane-fatty-acyl-phospholipid synthase [Prosthecochloris sp. GSB1]
MFGSYFKKQAEALLEPAGVLVNGPNPWDIRVLDDRLFHRMLLKGNLGLGEAYMDGWWECDALDQLFFRILRSGLAGNIMTFATFSGKLAGQLFNLQNPSRAFSVGKKHYDIGNDLFSAMLDSRMNYSCGYWRDCETLDRAQENKLRLVFDKLMLSPGMTVLDIGCGWGGAARFAAERYGVQVTGVTVSVEQAEFARSRCRGLPVSIQLCDYRKIDHTFDRIYSIGMFEHVGHKNYRSYFRSVERCLAPNGLSLLHTIGGNISSSCTDPWISRYIFPNSMIPSASQIAKASEGLLVIEDWHVFGDDYYRTLKSWHHNLLGSREELLKKYGERFYRMWEYYLLSCAGAFLARYLHLWQVLFSQNGIISRKEVAR